MEYVNIALKLVGLAMIIFSINGRLRDSLTKDDHITNTHTGLLFLILGSV